MGSSSVPGYVLSNSLKVIKSAGPFFGRKLRLPMESMDEPEDPLPPSDLSSPSSEREKRELRPSF